MSSTDADFPSDLRTLEREYELIRELGQGGMAAVYLARSRKTGELVAIKAIRARYRDDPDAIRRFAREAETVARLDHPNIVRTLAIEQIDERAVAIIMEHVPGGTVRDWLRERGSLGAEHAESVLRDVARALAYAHRLGIVHRDVKPENIVLDAERGRAVLSDFGIARSIDGDSAITLLGAALGTPQYMSPEQIDGGVVDGRSDVYSLGVLGWELLTGRRPWAGDSLYGVIYKQKHEDLPRITLVRPRVSANLLFAIEGALVKDKTKRWQTAEEFLDRLTYNAPPVLTHAYPPSAQGGDDAATVFFRSSALESQAAGQLPPPDAADVGATPERGGGAGPGPDLVATRRPLVGDGADGFDVPVSPPLFANANYGFPEFDPNADPTFASAQRTRRMRVARAAGLLIPLGVAAASLFVVLGGSVGKARGGPGRSVTASAGSVEPPGRHADVPAARSVPAVVPNESTHVVADPDPLPPDDEPPILAQPAGNFGSPARSRTPAPVGASTRRAAERFAGIRAGTTSTAGRMVATSTPESEGDSSPQLLRPADSSPHVTRPTGSATNSTGGGRRVVNAMASATPDADARTNVDSAIDDPFRIPASPASPAIPDGGRPATSGAAAGAVPTSRCLIAATADQQACLSAYVAVGDAPLTRAFDALVAALRRAANTPPGSLDPQSVERARVEQRVWLSVRENECRRTPSPGAPPFWAKELAQCFNEMAAVRARDLREAARRAGK